MFLTISLFSSKSERASGQQPSGLSLEQAIKNAVAHHPRLAAILRDEQAAKEGLRSAKFLSNPTNAYFAPALGEINGTTEEFLFTQPLEMNGTRAAREGIAQAQLRSVQAQATTELRDLILEVKVAYHNLHRAEEQVRLANKSLETATEFYRIAQRQAELGSRPGIDSVQANLEVGRARQILIAAEGQQQSACASLNTLMGRSPASPIEALQPTSVPPPSTDSHKLTALALASRTEIGQQAALAEVYRQEARLSRASALPDIAPQFRAGRVVNGGIREYGFALVIGFPLDWGSPRAKTRQATFQAEAQQERVTAMQRHIELEVAQAVARVRTAAQILKEYDNGILENAQRLLNASKIGFEAGQTNIVSLLEAQRTYRTIRSERIQAETEYALASAALEHATGSVSSESLRTRRKELNTK